MQTKVTEDGKNIALCGCGRSPTGDCIGWHSLTNEQYKVKLHEWNQEQNTGKQLLNENSRS
jgi:CDGSH-type Zn-finger protein